MVDGSPSENDRVGEIGIEDISSSRSSARIRGPNKCGTVCCVVFFLLSAIVLSQVVTRIDSQGRTVQL